MYLLPKIDWYFFFKERLLIVDLQVAAGAQGVFISLGYVDTDRFTVYFRSIEVNISKKIVFFRWIPNLKTFFPQKFFHQVFFSVGCHFRLLIF